MFIKRRKNTIIHFRRIELFFIWSNLNPLYPRRHSAKFGKNWPSGSSELTPLKKGRDPSFEQTWIPITQEGIVPILVEIGPVVLEKKIFFHFVYFFRYFVIISPWKRIEPLHFNKLESPLPKKALCLVWLKLAQWFLRRRFFKFRQCIFAIFVIISPW